MANHDLDDVFANFGCFDDSDVPSLFEDFESLNNLPNAESSPASGSASPEYELMSVCSPASSTSYHDHSYNVNSNNNTVTPGPNTPNDPVMTGSVSPERDWSPSPGPSPGGSVSSAQEESSDLLLYLMNEAGVQISEKGAADSHDADSDIDCDTLAKQQIMSTTTVSSSASHSSRGKKRHFSNTSTNNEDHVQEKNRKNAIAARENRLKKKRYVENLEKENKALSTENAQLTIENDQMKSRVCSLEAEVDYLKSVLYNQSALSGLLKKLGHNSEVRLSSSFQTRKQPGQEQLKPTSGGVCLHVNGKDASLEFCAQCSVLAAGVPRQ